MPDEGDHAKEPQQPDPGRPRFWDRCKRVLDAINQKFAYLVGLPIVAALVSAFVGHFDYLTTYQDKVNAAAKEQIAAAELAFNDISGTFSKAITLQQILYFNYRDAIHANIDGDERAMETKNARALYKQYDDLHTEIRENIDLVARRVEMNLDWASDIGRDSAHAGPIGSDPMSRIALGAYDFDCDNDKYMPSFKAGSSNTSLPVTADRRKSNPNATPLGIDWYSAKHQLLTLYYCFEVNHRRIAVVRAWAANSPVDAIAKTKFADSLPMIQDSFDREAIRLHAFMTLAASRIEGIRVKFRPRVWYCHVPIVREIIDAYSKKCTPLRTAQN